MALEERSKRRDYAAVKREFAAERSHRDSQLSNEHARAAAQVVALLNGGAAAAVLAFLSRDKLDARVLDIAAWAIGAFAVGAICAVAVIWAMSFALKIGNAGWQHVLRNPYNPQAGRAEHTCAEWWTTMCIVAFGISMALFLIGCGLMAHAIARYPPLAPLHGSTIAT